MPYRRPTKKRFSSIRLFGRFDWSILLCIFLLCGFGILMLYEASAVFAFSKYHDRLHFVREQIRWISIGGIGMIAASLFPYKKLYNFALPLLGITIFLLIAVILIGIGDDVHGASRWLNVGILRFQPSELAKLSLIIYLSAWFSQPQRHRLIPFLLLMATVFGLIIAQPDLGTAILVLAIALILYFASGAPISHAFFLLPIGVLFVLFLAILAPYRFARLTTFINPERDPLGSSYQIRQVLISLGSGGWFGVGLGRSLQKYGFVPEARTDSIFAIIAEELGFVGSISLLLVFSFFLLRGLRVASHAPDRFGKLLAIGIISWVGVQTAINLSAMVALLPLTGIPLPLISYGGSSLILLLVGIGILLNISRQYH